MTNIPHTAILLVNLGTPDSASTGDVRKYLREFLLDKRVIDINPVGRWLLVNGIIAPFRAPKSAKEYRKIWDDKGSPIKWYGEQLTKQVQVHLGEEYMVRLAMRYQSPSIHEVLEEVKTAAVKRIKVIPLFPQYASATSGSVHDKIMEELMKWQLIPDVHFEGPFFDNEKFIEAFADRGREKMEEKDWDHFIFSFHGLPERQIYKGDSVGVCKLGECCNQVDNKNYYCYRAQCFETAKRIAAKLEIPGDKYSTSFQSRLGKTPWIQPYTEDTVIKLAKDGKEKVLCFSPAFVADCLETIVELGEEYMEVFEEHGGKEWDFVESLNLHPKWIELVCDMATDSHREKQTIQTQAV